MGKWWFQKLAVSGARDVAMMKRSVVENEAQHLPNHPGSGTKSLLTVDASPTALAELASRC